MLRAYQPGQEQNTVKAGFKELLLSRNSLVNYQCLLLFVVSYFMIYVNLFMTKNAEGNKFLNYISFGTGYSLG